MDPADVALRNRTYQRFVQLGRAPTATEMAGSRGRLGRDAARQLAATPRRARARAGRGRRRDPHGQSVLAVPTSFRVSAGGRSWFANCAWDAFGIPAALGVDGDVEATCPDCHEVLRVAVTDRRPSEGDLVFHVLVPAAEWWADIGYT